MDVNSRHHKLMVNIYMFTFARNLRKQVSKVAKLHCYGFEIDHPSQAHHTCLMWTELEHLYMYHEEAMEHVDLNNILESWKQEMELTEIPKDSRDHFTSLLQTSEWKQTFDKREPSHLMVERMIALEDRFTN